VDTPDRYALRAVQTPQGFDRSVLDAAHASAAEATDDAALVEALGVRVLTIDGDVRATKITTPADLLAAQGAR
jgi:2-C-methyl-D-erythritol 4-phosphate cytidylyltransferase